MQVGITSIGYLLRMFQTARRTNYEYEHDQCFTPRRCSVHLGILSRLSVLKLNLVMFRFGRIAQGGARVAYISFTDRGALNKLFRTFKTSPESIHSPAMPSVPSVPSILEEYHSEVAKAYSKSRKEIRQSAEAALAHYEEEQNVMCLSTVPCRQ